jgi:Kef-type K+ transport system membrane component KefB|tara:strand:- start:1886 stop:2167 length:282 start_codon:yes stop_codon:yes gene_type:complete
MQRKAEVFFRTVAAIIGGYFVSAIFSIAFVPILVWLQWCDQNEAVMIATMLSYIIYFAVIIISFSRQSTLLLWRDIVLTLCIGCGTYSAMGNI